MTDPSTLSMAAFYAMLRNQVLDYVDPDGYTNRAAVTDLYRLSAPDNASAPYGVLSIKSPQSVADQNHLKLAADVEVMWFGRPRKTQPDIEALGDRTVQALLTFRNHTSGLTYFSSATSESLPAFSAPADRELVQVRVLARVQSWPRFISRLSN
jgi:hypothetical protein